MRVRYYDEYNLRPLDSVARSADVVVQSLFPSEGGSRAISIHSTVG